MADLRGRVALVTGGRVKIGFRIVLKLLQDIVRVNIKTCTEEFLLHMVAEWLRHTPEDPDEDKNVIIGDATKAALTDMGGGDIDTICVAPKHVTREDFAGNVRVLEAPRL